MGFFNFITGKKNAPPPTTATATSASSPAAQKANVIKGSLLGRSFTRGVNYVPAEEVPDFSPNTTGKRLTAYLNKARVNNAKLADKAAYINTDFDYEDVINNGKTGPKREKKTLRARFYGKNDANAARTYRNFRKTLSNAKKANFNKKEKAFQGRLTANAASASKAAAEAAKAQAYAAAGRNAPKPKASILNSFGKKPANKSASVKPLAGQAVVGSTNRLGTAAVVNAKNVQVSVESALNAKKLAEFRAEQAAMGPIGALPKPSGSSEPIKALAPPPGSKAATTAVVPPPLPAAPPAVNRVGAAFPNSVVAPVIEQAQAVEAGKAQMAANMKAAQAKAPQGVMQPGPATEDPFAAAAKAIGLAGGRRRRMSRKKRHMRRNEHQIKKHKSRRV